MKWPPNHTLREVRIVGVSDPNSLDVKATITSVGQDEPLNGDDEQRRRVMQRQRDGVRAAECPEQLSNWEDIEEDIGTTKDGNQRNGATR